MFINHVHKAYEAKHGPFPHALFKEKLFHANRARHLNLSRNDMPEATKGNDDPESEISWGGDERGLSRNHFHFVNMTDYTPKRQQYEQADSITPPSLLCQDRHEAGTGPLSPHRGSTDPAHAVARHCR